jgi:probable rRNA maturation factor
VTDRPPSRQTRRRVGPDDGSVTVFVADERSAGRQEQPVDAARWIALAEAVLATEGVRGEVELSVLFVGEDVIAELNEQHLGASGPTDVLSFPIDGEQVEPGRWPDGGGPGPDRLVSDPDGLPLLLGDVVICPSVAAANAPAHAGTYDDEVALLLVHGILHLLGMDHADDADRVAMQARERQHLEANHGPLARDPWAEAGA